VCGTVFQPVRRAHRFCSSSCRTLGWHRQREERVRQERNREVRELLLTAQESLDAAMKRLAAP
jgi:hypothetical protein